MLPPGLIYDHFGRADLLQIAQAFGNPPPPWRGTDPDSERYQIARFVPAYYREEFVAAVRLLCVRYMFNLVVGDRSAEGAQQAKHSLATAEKKLVAALTAVHQIEVDNGLAWRAVTEAAAAADQDYYGRIFPHIDPPQLLKSEERKATLGRFRVNALIRHTHALCDLIGNAPMEIPSSRQPDAFAYAAVFTLGALLWRCTGKRPGRSNNPYTEEYDQSELKDLAAASLGKVFQFIHPDKPNTQPTFDQHTRVAVRELPQALSSVKYHRLFVGLSAADLMDGRYPKT